MTSMRTKYFIIGMLLSSLMVYLEWGGGQHLFLYETELDVLYRLVTNPNSVLHPLVLLPIVGQILLICALFHSPIKRNLVVLGIIGLSTLLCTILLVGILDTNLKIFASTLPFFLFCVLTLRALFMPSIGDFTKQNPDES